MTNLVRWGCGATVAQVLCKHKAVGSNPIFSTYDRNAGGSSMLTTVLIVLAIVALVVFLARGI